MCNVTNEFINMRKIKRNISSNNLNEKTEEIKQLFTDNKYMKVCHVGKDYICINMNKKMRVKREKQPEMVDECMSEIVEKILSQIYCITVDEKCITDLYNISIDGKQLCIVFN